MDMSGNQRFNFLDISGAASPTEYQLFPARAKG
jgi:hypothetical protein